MRKRLADLRQLALDFIGVSPPVSGPNQAPAPAPYAQVATNTVAEGAGQQPAASLADLLAATHFAHPQATRQIQLEGCTVAYAFQRGRRRTIGFSVGPEGLAVRAPRWVPLHEVDAALRAKSAWIARKLGEARERQQRAAEARIEWRDGARFPLFGEPVRLALDGARATVLERPADGAATPVLRVALPPFADSAQVRDAVQAWLGREARAHFTQRLNHFAPQLGVRWTRLALTNAGTRWGSAKSDGSIRLHWRLMHFRPAVIDYVVVHELSHLRVMDHSPRFWDTVATVLPDYAALRGELRHDALPAL